MKKILLIVCTHGDEKLGIEIIEELHKEKLEEYFDVLVANPEALKRKTRFY